jgi:hypothetical protein
MENKLVSWLVNAWRGRTECIDVFRFYYLPCVGGASCLLISLADEEPPIHPHMSHWLWSMGILSGRTIWLWLTGVTLILIFALRSLWACAPNVERLASMIVARLLVTLTAFALGSMLFVTWLFSEFVIEEQSCMDRASTELGVDESVFVEDHYREAFSVCVKDRNYLTFSHPS